MPRPTITKVILLMGAFTLLSLSPLPTAGMAGTEKKDSAAGSEGIEGIVSEVPVAITNALLAVESKKQGPLCTKRFQDSEEDAHRDPGTFVDEEVTETGVIEYKVAPVNAHQGGTLSQKALEEKAKELKVELTEEQWKNLADRYKVSTPEVPGIREEVVHLPFHIKIEKVDYLCKGEFCGWCYHPEAATRGYEADVEILPSGGQGQSVRWRRLYTGREVDESYFIHWKRIGPGPNPPAVMKQKRKISRPKQAIDSQVWAFNVQVVGQILQEAKQRRPELEEEEGPKRICQGKSEGYLIKELAIKCCQDHGGVHNVKVSSPAAQAPNQVPAVEAEIECRWHGKRVDLSELALTNNPQNN